MWCFPSALVRVNGEVAECLARYPDAKTLYDAVGSPGASFLSLPDSAETASLVSAAALICARNASSLSVGRFISNRKRCEGSLNLDAVTWAVPLGSIYQGRVMHMSTDNICGTSCLIVGKGRVKLVRAIS